MKYRLLGDTGLLVSELSFGSWVTFKEGGQVSDGTEAFKIMKKAYEGGVNFFDNAEAYAEGQAEEIMGKAIHMGLEQGVWTREDLIVSTKLFFGSFVTAPSDPTKDVPGYIPHRKEMNRVGLSRKHIVEGCRASLKRMNLEYVDLVFCHRFDYIANIEEVVRSFNFLIDQGLCFYWGTSEWSAEEIREAKGIAEKLGMVGPSFDQPQYNMLVRDRVEVEYSRLYPQLGLTIWSPLAGGVLTGKYKSSIPEGTRMSTDFFGGHLKKENKTPAEIQQEKEFNEKVALAERLREYAHQTFGLENPTQLALAWCMANPNVSTVITGATSEEQVVENLKAVELIEKLTPEAMTEIESILDNKPSLPRQAKFAKTFRGNKSQLRYNKL